MKGALGEFIVLPQSINMQIANHCYTHTSYGSKDGYFLLLWWLFFVHTRHVNVTR